MPPRILIGDAAGTPHRVEAAGGRLRLPSVRIEPDGLDLPPDARPLADRLGQVRAVVEGDPAGLLVLNTAYAVGQALWDFNGQPLREPETIDPWEIADGRVPPGEYRLRVTVTYRAPPARPDQPPGPEGQAEAVRDLVVGDGPGPRGPGPRVTCRWQHQELIVGRSAAELIVFAENLPAGAVPALTVSDPDDGLVPALRDALNRHLAATTPRLLREQTPTAPAAYLYAITARFDDRPAGFKPEATLVDLRVAVRRPGERADLVGGVVSGKQALRVDFPENQFPGYPVLDLGTSTTFALIHYYHLPRGILPVEQERTIRHQLLRWLDGEGRLPAAREWPALLAQAAAELDAPAARDGRDPAAALRTYLRRRPPGRGSSDNALHTVVRAVEKAAQSPALSREFCLALRRELSGLYARAFRRFPLEEKGLVPAELDPSRPPDESAEATGAVAGPIPSTTQVTAVRAATGRSVAVEVDIGQEADDARRAAGAASPESLLTRFHSSPKNYYPLLGQPGARVEVSAGGPVERVTPRAFLVASLRRLRERVEQYRDRSGILESKRFGKFVMTFPTSAPLSVRTEILAAAREAGFDEPYADLDEALSAVVFYLVNPFGADLEMGLEAFRTSCRPVLRGGGAPPVEWVQNILLIDVGGGTTDIALVEAKLTDEQAKEAGDGSRGRYYKLTPKLLGTAGRPQLAGNLLTLGVFHALKKRIADAVLSALDPAGGPPESAGLLRLVGVAAKLPAPFTDGSGSRYQPGAILPHYPDHVLWEDGGLPRLAFGLANEVLPTAWRDAPDDASRARAARTFYALWQIAEDAKVRVFGRADGDAEAVVTPAQIGDLLGVTAADGERLGVHAVALGRDEFREIVEPPLEEIADLAFKVVADRLPPDRPTDDGPARRVLDRVILTGQTCRIDHVRAVVARRLQAEFGGRAGLGWDPSAVTFEGEYAKQAAAIGAAYARQAIERRVPSNRPTAGTPLNGNVLDIEIQNLFFFLQSGFTVLEGGANRYRSVLAAGDPFVEFDRDGVGHLRSQWDIVPREVLLIDKADTDTEHTPWGWFDCVGLAAGAGLAFPTFQAEVQMAIETDHRLVVSVLFCRGPEPHYALSPGDGLDIPARVAAVFAGSAPAPRPDEGPLAHLTGWAVGINMDLSGGRGQTLFPSLSADIFDRTFRAADGSRRRGAVVGDLSACPADGTDRVFVCPNDGSGGWTQIGELTRPADPAGRRVSVQAVLDETGGLRLHLGGVPFWTGQADKDLLDAGTVLRKPLVSAVQPPDDLRNPFCGRH